MCYYEQTRWSCGYWKWGNFRQQCNKEYRTGETCGLRLVYETAYLGEQCRKCEQMGKKQRRVCKMLDDVARWKLEGNRRATIEKTQRDIAEVQLQIQELWDEHEARKRSVV